MKGSKGRAAAMFVIIGFVLSAVVANGQMHHDGAMKKDAKSPGRAAPPAPIRIPMAALHAQGGVPRGWKFLVPSGDVAGGRKVFVSMECFACHEIKGEEFPRESKTPRGAGPDLTGMGSHHPAEYFAESILNPNRVIVEGTGYTGPDGLSKMPSYADTMTLKQLTDVVAYLTSLTGGEMAHSGHDMSGSMKTK
jgi:mono/diheme cytochrome c family protein